MPDEDNDPDVLAAKAFFEWWRSAKNRVRWWALAASAAMIILHWIIEANYLTFGPFGPTAHPPIGLALALQGAVLATLLLALFCFPRWQSILAFLAIVFLILSLGGR